jgi:hypothetical protein
MPGVSGLRALGTGVMRSYTATYHSEYAVLTQGAPIVVCAPVSDVAPILGLIACLGCMPDGLGRWNMPLLVRRASRSSQFLSVPHE